MADNWCDSAWNEDCFASGCSHDAGVSRRTRRNTRTKNSESGERAFTIDKSVDAITIATYRTIGRDQHRADSERGRPRRCAGPARPSDNRRHR